jgi:hypothetical protein
VARSHYEILGVSPTASTDDIRRAYVQRAREAHPDRHIDAGAVEREAAAKSMREINEAWRVLGDERRRRHYDLERVPDDRFVTRSDGTMPPEVVYDEIDPTTRLIRGLPWMILVAVLFAIFVFTAYAATGGGGATGSCVTTDGTTITKVQCDAPGARHVVTTVDASQPCPSATERLQPSTGALAYCLKV